MVWPYHTDVCFNHSYPVSVLEILFPKVRAELVRLLFADSSKELHLRELCRLSRLAVGTLQAAAAVPVRDIPKETLARWIARDEAEMEQFTAAPKRKKK